MKRADMVSSSIAEKIFGVAMKSNGSRAVSYVNTGRCEVCHPSKDFIKSLVNQQEFKEDLDSRIRTFEIEGQVFYWVDQFFFGSSKWEKQSHCLKDFYSKLVRSPLTIMFDPTTGEVVHNSVKPNKPTLKSK